MLEETHSTECGGTLGVAASHLGHSFSEQIKASAAVQRTIQAQGFKMNDTQ